MNIAGKKVPGVVIANNIEKNKTGVAKSCKFKGS